jgi:hypothetical protein
MARPTIISDKIIQAFDAVLNDGMNAIILTDEELITLVNDKLPEEERFSWSAYKDWKAFALGTKTDTTAENIKLYQRLGSLIKKALIMQKQSLFKKLQTEPQWQRYAWILERKFSEWNLKHVSEASYDVNDKFEQAVQRAEAIAIKYGGATDY